jgi:hypothetical protein
MTQVETPPRGRQVEPAIRESPIIVPGPIAAKQPRSIVRMVLLILGPVAALAVLGWLYFSGGRYVTEENAYVGASTVATAPQVAGQVSQINVTQNQHVDAQQVLFVIDPEPYQIAVDGARAQLGITRSQILAQIATWQADEQLAKQAEANLTFAQQELARMQQLVGRSTATQEQSSIRPGATRRPRRRRSPRRRPTPGPRLPRSAATVISRSSSGRNILRPWRSFKPPNAISASPRSRRPSAGS